MDMLCTDRKQYTNQSKLVGYKVFHIGVLYVESLFSVCYTKFRGGGGGGSIASADAEAER